MSDEHRSPADGPDRGHDQSAGGVDPAPEVTPGLEPGGGVAPGDTPPDTPQTSGLSFQQPPTTRHFPVSGIGALIGAGLLIVAMIVVIVGIVVMVL
ncbi:hypothetical protein IA539_05250 [Gordonia sp. zg691]|uniref:Uncharacterized protein n=1 Tax=Gordonia jinghuaiqii TaxID=2758710 RepID=A0A7D7LW70_9ACTN|nr:DUF6480 family protein [Gordonia jinghuaiqii]MBD0860613.1 hypothetical protein [Gordonia jinghuaiqii]MCR5978121.1 hypothetical protein [Gordonia jinghuaiqii]QMT01419.1 hypothetical protein H1R19_21805 [Gordonia jinghuaiqii]